jgi:VIT1/CCC1 family predicted Fe2+/Mn2+ transporter
MDNTKEIINIILSIITVILFVIAIIVFIDYGGNAIFYAIVVLALILGFLNAWLISKGDEHAKGTRQRKMASGGKAAAGIRRDGRRRR